MDSHVVSGQQDTRRVVCLSCGESYGERDPRTVCDCGGLLSVQPSLMSIDAAALRGTFDERWGCRSGIDGSGVWRYRELIGDFDRVVTRPEGNTNIYDIPAVAHWCGLAQVGLKHEGENPTGSFKDRGMTVGVSQAVRVGARAVLCASTGNTSSSLASYAALAGLRCIVLVPAGKVAIGKLAQTIAHGAHVVQVKGSFDDALVLARQASRSGGLYLLNSVNPWRLEGQKSIVFELAQQLGWTVPDWIVLPGGNLGNTAAFGKALRELKEVGLISRLSRLAVIQAAGANPFQRAFCAGFGTYEAVIPHTVASAINIGNPANYERARRAIQETNGYVEEVSDDELLEAKAVVDRAGIGCEPASAAAVAGVRKLVSRGIIGRGERVVAILTGHVLKDPENAVGSQSWLPGSAVVVPAEAAALRQALEGAALWSG